MSVPSPARTAAARPRRAARPGVREAAALATREAILRAAIRVFSRYGFDGGRVERISASAGSYDRMIYYYFGSKEGLYVAVLEELYRRFNEAESRLELDLERPVDALAEVTRFVWNYYRRHPEFITLLNTENLHRGRHIAKSRRAREYSFPAVRVLGDVLEHGARKGLFRRTADARDVYLMIAAMGYFYLSNRYTLSAFLGEPLESAAAMAHWEAFIVDAVLRAVLPPDALPPGTPPAAAGKRPRGLLRSRRVA
ncbi:HTH-type transcriptional repressor NicS [Burkholderiales bacterium]|nr:HTH-type transcriptional repressor NicS [Burkholderiales bacterium]